MKLFDDDDDQNEDISKIEINEEYARRFEHNKKREDLHRYQELKNKGVIDSSDSDESSSSDEEIHDLPYWDALIKVRNQDPILKQKDVKLFNSDNDEEEEEEKEEEEGNKDVDRKEKKKKKMFLKDVNAKYLIEEGPDFDDTEEVDKGRKMSYNEEQEQYRKPFLVNEGDDDEDDDDGEDFFKLKDKGVDKEVDNGDTSEFDNKLNEYFGDDSKLDEKELYLRDYFKKGMWKEKDRDKKIDIDDDEMEEVIRDEEEIEKQEEYEQGYNFRYEENAGDRLMSFPRKIEGSVRKEDNARKEKRKKKDEKLRLAEIERKEELKHMKNLKKKDMEEKMKKVLEAAGIKGDDCLLDLDDLEEEFDPDQYDKMMKTTFNEKYYEEQDMDPHFASDSDEEDAELKKPDFDKEDELLGLAPKSCDGFLATRERILKQKPETGDDESSGEEEVEEEQEDEEEVEQESEKESKRKRKRKISDVKKFKEEMMDEYYKLDYEDTIEDLKTRFKYAKVNPNRFGLKTKEILLLDEKDLNQYVSLKKIAPYQEKEWKVPSSKTYEQKIKAKEILRGLAFPDRKAGKKKTLKHETDKKKTSENKTEKEEKEKVAESVSDVSKLSTKAGKKKTLKHETDKKKTSENKTEKEEKEKVAESVSDVSKLSKKAKRRLSRGDEFKLSESRLLAYGKIQPDSKRKGKK